jgi:hypothetical protein
MMLISSFQAAGGSEKARSRKQEAENEMLEAGRKRSCSDTVF